MNGLGLNEQDDRPEDDSPDDQTADEPVISNPYYDPPTNAESARNMGLGYAAGITFFATIAFMLFLGWGADLILGSRPWGIVVGIVLGAVIAFIQFFRITSRIYSKPADIPAVKPLSSPQDEDDSL